jgi:hypothetical protein
MMNDEIILIMVVIKLGLDILNKSIDLFSKMHNLIPKKKKIQIKYNNTGLLTSS